MNKPNPETWLLARSFSRGEKNHFKKWVGKETGYTRLFDRLFEMNEWESPTRTKTGQVPQNKDYIMVNELRRKMLLFLIARENRDRTPSLAGIGLLVHRAPCRSTWKRLKKAIAKAKDEEDYSSGLELCRLALEELPEGLIPPKELIAFEWQETGFLGMAAGITHEGGTYRDLTRCLNQHHPRSEQVSKGVQKAHRRLFAAHTFRIKELFRRLLTGRTLALQAREINEVREYGDKALRLWDSKPAWVARAGMQDTLEEVRASHLSLCPKEECPQFKDPALALLTAMLRGEASSEEENTWHRTGSSFDPAIGYLLTKRAFARREFQRATDLLGEDSQHRYLPAEMEIKEEMELLRSLCALATGQILGLHERHKNILKGFSRKNVWEGSPHQIFKALNYLIRKPKVQQTPARFFSRLPPEELKEARGPIRLRGMWLLPAVQIVPAMTVLFGRE